MAIKQLQIETHHRGFYLLLRLVVQPVRLTAIISLAEDEQGDVAPFSLYLQGYEHVRPATDILKEKSVLLLKEPYFVCLDAGGYGIRVDHPTDIVWLSNDDPRIPVAWRSIFDNVKKTVEQWKQEGNALVKSGKHRDAIEMYSKALKSSPTSAEVEVLHNNRALAYLRLEMYDAVLEETAYVADPTARLEKSLYRGAQALYNLGRYEEAAELLRTLVARFPDSTSGASELSRATLRVEEKKSGKYDFKKMSDSAKLIPPFVDCANFAGPVEVRQIKGKGRGLFNTKAVKAGDLLLCEKAFSYCFGGSEQATNKNISKLVVQQGLLISFHTNHMIFGTGAGLITNTYQTLMKNPSLAPKLVDLYHGSYKETSQLSVDGMPVVDFFLIEQIIRFNSFGCPPISSKDSKSSETKSEHFFDSTGIWLLPSYINHSCIANCERTFIGDMIIVRAAGDINASTELSSRYKNTLGRSDVREPIANNLDSWGFKCACAICEDHTRTPEALEQKRKNILSTTIFTLSENVFDELEKTYVSLARHVPRFDLFQVHWSIARQCSEKPDANTMVLIPHHSVKALDAIGFVLSGLDDLAMPEGDFKVRKWGLLVPEILSTWKMLWTAWNPTFPHSAQSVERYWKLSYSIVVSGETESFEEYYHRSGKL